MVISVYVTDDVPEKIRTYLEGHDIRNWVGLRNTINKNGGGHILPRGKVQIVLTIKDGFPGKSLLEFCLFAGISDMKEWKVLSPRGTAD